GVKGLGEIVVGARGQALHHVVLLRDAGDHDDVDVRRLRGADPLAQLEAGKVGHHAIGDDHRWVLALEDDHGLAAVARLVHGGELARQRVLQHSKMQGRIVDNQDLESAHPSGVLYHRGYFATTPNFAVPTFWPFRETEMSTFQV